MRRVALATGLTALLALTGCADDSDSLRPASPSAATDATPAANSTGDRVQVVTSIDVYADIARTIGGDAVEVRSLLASDSGADPHSYEATARDQLAVRDADLVIANGGHYDEFLTRALSAAGGDRAVITVVPSEADEHADETPEEHAEHTDESDDHEGETPEEHAEHAGEGAEHEGAEHEDEGHDEGHDHGRDGNEHVWYDLQLMGTLAGRIAEELAQLHPADRDGFTARATEFENGIAELRQRQESMFSVHDGTPVAVTEPLPLFLLTDCGLVDRTPPAFSQAIEEGTDVPVRVLQDTLNLFSDGAVELLVYNEQTTGPQTERIRSAAEDADIPVVAMSETLPTGQDFLSWMRTNLDALEGALA
ncbi:metal ABC transporter solute-binding protein, Zn/Mn family [Sporichthya polymorpha]|uniref:metal ABC transporter solute-binding protein, Zn/Mn family n=1 Tax=Sporichthya polymorpha TaxID=35751 RepID=UPI00036AA069|nr:zinc ABC transporter substrate-binding protein [Sporichthya polymorpha]